MTNLMQYVDVCIGNEEDAEGSGALGRGNADFTSGELELAGYVDIFNQMWLIKFGFKYIISSLRESRSASITAGLPALWMERHVSSATPESTTSHLSLTV